METRNSMTTRASACNAAHFCVSRQSRTPSSRRRPPPESSTQSTRPRFVVIIVAMSSAWLGCGFKPKAMMTVMMMMMLFYLCATTASRTNNRVGNANNKSTKADTIISASQSPPKLLTLVDPQLEGSVLCFAPTPGGRKHRRATGQLCRIFHCRQSQL